MNERRSRMRDTRVTVDEGHEHGEECDALYAEWRRYHAAVIDPAGRYTRQQQLLARHERERFERQLRALGCSGEASYNFV